MCNDQMDNWTLTPPTPPRDLQAELDRANQTIAEQKRRLERLRQELVAWRDVYPEQYYAPQAGAIVYAPDSVVNLL